MKVKPTQRGFLRGEWIDRYETRCSVQESSLATEPCIWLGVDDKRMHLTVDMVSALLPQLQHFTDTGRLKAAQTERDGE